MMKSKLTSIRLVATILIAGAVFLFSCNNAQKGKGKDGKDATTSSKDSGKTGSGDSASGKDSSNSSTSVKEKGEPPVMKERMFNDVARLLAGLPQEKGSSLDSLEKTAAWKSHAANFNRSWASISKKRLDPMANWAAKELKEINSNGNDMFYPFSGPDFMNMYTFFPEAKTYTMLALEPAGFLPNANKFSEEGMNVYLNSVQKDLKDIFTLSFFITKNMHKDLVHSTVNGALPLISIFIVRKGNKILNIERVRINQDGKVVSMPNDTTVRAVNSGVKITFQPNGKNETRTVYYFSTDISDVGLEKNPGMSKYLSAMGPQNSYLKSASYLLHYDHFSKFRNLLLDKSDHLLQDDAGVAYRFFKKDIWDVQLYGKWVKPIPLFHKMEQPDLKEAYQKDSANVRPIPFSIGYNFSSKDSPILLLANKKGKK